MNKSFVGEHMEQAVSNEIGEWLSALNRYCLAITGSKWDAEDLVQETCLRALPVLTGLQKHANPTALLLRTAKNLSIDHSRRKKSQADGLDKCELLQKHEHEDSSGMEQVLSLLVQYLSPLQCSIFLLRELYGYRASEVAAALRSTEGAVKAALFRARTAMSQIKRDMLKEDRVEHAPSELQQRLLLAYMTAIRQINPQAIVLLAMSQSDQVDPVQAIATIIQMPNLPRKKKLHASQSSLLRAAA
ncbi:RNA polymerase sigma factor [Paenibacillus solisilvae]|uniref:RNA polymerase sigma factor n=1 Tax=Paenibacillus solisilvae TaxID=2486751 RepID=A0ABW0VZL8_9BACL